VCNQGLNAPNQALRQQKDWNDQDSEKNDAEYGGGKTSAPTDRALQLLERRVGGHGDDDSPSHQRYERTQNPEASGDQQNGEADEDAGFESPIDVGFVGGGCFKSHGEVLLQG
jgi:hypothetical protein